MPVVEGWYDPDADYASRDDAPKSPQQQQGHCQGQTADLLDNVDPDELERVCTQVELEHANANAPSNTEVAMSQHVPLAGAGAAPASVADASAGATVVGTSPEVDAIFTSDADTENIGLVEAKEISRVSAGIKIPDQDAILNSMASKSKNTHDQTLSALHRYQVFQQEYYNDNTLIHDLPFDTMKARLEVYYDKVRA
jgi:hypothetical protein